MQTTSDVFVRTTLNDKTTLKPWHMNNLYREQIAASMQARFEGKCTHHGYIKPGSIVIKKISPGIVQDFSLNGDVVYRCLFDAEVCNPATGSIIEAVVKNVNRFGARAECTVDNGYNTTAVVIEVILAKHLNMDIDLETLKINQTIKTEILGKKFELSDTKISVLGKVIDTSKSIQVAVENEEQEDDDEDDDAELIVDDGEELEDDDNDVESEKKGGDSDVDGVSSSGSSSFDDIGDDEYDDVDEDVDASDSESI